MSKEAHQSTRSREEAGSAVFELILLSVPLCVLSMVLASQLAATSQARLRAQWQATLAAQANAQNLCGGNAALNAPFQGMVTSNVKSGAISSDLAHISKVGPIISGTGLSMNRLTDLIATSNTFPADVLQQKPLTDTNWTTKEVTTSLAPFYFQKQANAMLPTAAQTVTARATFVCQEPIVNGPNLDGVSDQLLVWAFDEAAKFHIR